MTTVSARDALTRFNQYCQQQKITFATLLSIDNDYILTLPEYLLNTTKLNLSNQTLEFNEDQWFRFIHDELYHLLGYLSAYQDYDSFPDFVHDNANDAKERLHTLFAQSLLHT